MPSDRPFKQRRSFGEALGENCHRGPRSGGCQSTPIAAGDVSPMTSGTGRPDPGWRGRQAWQGRPPPYRVTRWRAVGPTAPEAGAGAGRARSRPSGISEAESREASAPLGLTQSSVRSRPL